MLRNIDVRLTDTGTTSPQFPIGEEVWVKQISNGIKQGWIYLQNKTGASVAAAAAAKIGMSSTAPYFRAIAIADLAAPERIIVAGATIAANSYGWWQFLGVCTLTVASATYTAGHGLRVHDAVIKTSGQAWANLDVEFGVIVTGGVTVTSITVCLQGRESLGVT